MALLLSLNVNKIYNNHYVMGERMIHTAEFYAVLENKTIGELEKNFKTNIKLINENIVCDEFKGIKFYFYKMYGVYRFNLYVDFIKLLGKSDINENDYTEIEKHLKKYLFLIFKDESSRLEIILKRLDFRKDIKIEKKCREILLKIYKKARKTSRFKKKNIEYDTSIYYSNKSMTVILYDKEQERNDKGKLVEDYEENILRLEVRLFPRHLNAQKREKSLKTYLNNEIFQKYIENNAFPIFYKGNHYKIELIEKKLIDNNIKAKDKNDILRFLKYISLYGYNSAINKRCDTGELKWSNYKVKKYIKLLESLNINPFIIPIREGINMIENKFMQ